MPSLSDISCGIVQTLSNYQDMVVKPLERMLELRTLIEESRETMNKLIDQATQLLEDDTLQVNEESHNFKIEKGSSKQTKVKVEQELTKVVRRQKFGRFREGRELYRAAKRISRGK
jgi:hypothetical protein